MATTNRRDIRKRQGAWFRSFPNWDLLGCKDPVDRFLAAAAKAYDLTLVTADERLLSVPGIKTLAKL